MHLCFPPRPQTIKARNSNSPGCSILPLVEHLTHGKYLMRVCVYLPPLPYAEDVGLCLDPLFAV